MDYATLVGGKGTPNSLADRVNYAPLVGIAAEIVKNVQDEIFARLRVREMRKSLLVTLTVGSYSLPLPSDFLDLSILIDPYGQEVKRVSEDRLLLARTFDANGLITYSYPTRVGLFDESLQFDYGASVPLTLRGMYFGAPYIGPQVNTNFLTQRYSQLFWSVLLKHGFAYYQDLETAGAYASQAEDFFNKIEQNADLDYRGLGDDESWEA